MEWRCADCTRQITGSDFPEFCPACGGAEIWLVPDEPSDEEKTRATMYVPDSRDEHARDL